MKIGIVCYPTVGGSGIVATELGHELAARGHEIHFITYDLPVRLHPDRSGIHFHRVEIFRYDLFKYPDYGLTLAVKMAEIAPQLDILHVHYAIPHATSGYLARQMVPDHMPPLITTLHGTDITLIGQVPALFELVKFSLRHSDAITAVSRSLRAETQSIFDIREDIQVIPNFVPLQSQKRKERPGAVLLHASNFRPVKRVLDVVSIFALVHQRLPEARLLLVGDGPEIAPSRALVASLNLTEQVEFVGEVQEMETLLAEADLFLLPSEQESFGLAALEAMAFGIPPIGTRVGGLPELIEEGVSGFLEDLGDVEAMADRALMLLTNHDLYAQVSKSAYSRGQNYSAERVVPEYVSLYESLSG